MDAPGDAWQGAKREGEDKERKGDRVVLKIGGKKKERCGMRNATRNTNIAKFNRGVMGKQEGWERGHVGEEQGTIVGKE